MSTPNPAPVPPPEPAPKPKAVTAVPLVPAAKRPIVVVKGISKRDIILICAIVVAVATFISLAMMSAAKKPKNTLTGVVKGKHSTGERETLLDVRPRKGVSGKTVDTGYYLKVFVAEENRTYDVIVEKALWDQKKEGDRLDFLRPPDEQKY